MYNIYETQLPTFVLGYLLKYGDRENQHELLIHLKWYI